MKHLLRQKLLLASFGILGLAALGIASMRPEQRDDEPPAAPPAQDFTKTVAGVGLVEAASENIVIGTPLSGLVEKVYVQVGQTVAAGQPLFRLDTRHLEADLAVRRAAEQAAQARATTQGELLADLDDQLSRIRKLDAQKVVSTDERKRIEFARSVAFARVAEAQAELASARAQSEAVATEIERSTIKAPVNATVLQVKIRRGEFVAAGASQIAPMILGDLTSLHVRVDIDEIDASRVDPTAAAYARPRGHAEARVPLEFVRFEPFIIPKRSLTGDPTERVDTRVLQCIYRATEQSVPLFIGQQMDVFLEAPPKTTEN